MAIKSILFSITLLASSSAFSAGALSVADLYGGGGTATPVPDVTIQSHLDGGTPLIDQSPDQVNGLYSDSACDLCGTGQQAITDQFVLIDAQTVAHVRFWGGYFPANLALATDSFTVIVHQDLGGSPDTAIYTATGLAATERNSTGVVLFGVDEYEYVIDLPTPPILPSGVYWLEIINDTTGSTESWFWETGNNDPIAGLPDSSFATETPGITWTNSSGVDMAFQLFVPQAALMPALNIPTLSPIALALLGLMLALLGGAIVYRKQRIS